jgi:rubrerythrin
MADLVEESLIYSGNHIQEILMLPIDMNCMNSQLVKRLASKIDVESLESLTDKKDKLKSKLFMKKLELLFEIPDNMLHRCINCNSLFTMAQREWQQCPKGEHFTDA